MNTKPRKTLLLINPANQLRKGFLVNRATKSQPLSLGILAALTPDLFKIKIIDENFRKFRFYEADLVGITAFTATAPRAYEIAAEYRQRGIPVVIGGIHASMVPDEAARFADSVVVGEAESVWPQILTDFLEGQLKSRYQGQLTNPIKQPLPRRDLFHPGYIAASIQTSRGCPMNCSFCSVSAFNGHHYRYREIEEVLDELESIPQKFVFFIDDNIVGVSSQAKERALQLFSGIIKRGIKKYWISQASLNFADDDQLLALAYRSGCRMIFLGVETEGIDQLTEAGKKVNLARLKDHTFNAVFNKIRRHGIGVIGGFIFGFDHDTPQTIRNRARFIRNSHLDSVQVSMLTPLPGTRLYDELKQQGRLLYTNYPYDWQRYDYFEPVHLHPSMTRHEQTLATYQAWHSIFNWSQLIFRAVKTLYATRSVVSTWMLVLNFYHYSRIALKGVEPTTGGNNFQKKGIKTMLK
ncbi:MAG: radical SAM protein [Bacteroidales bacterium]|nr:radical SAM protein [Bacteroidales bacterium]